jgi:predicted dehydrogenase
MTASAADPLRIAFSGGGMVAELHAAAIRRSPLARLVGIFDPDRALAKRRSDEWSCLAYPRFDALLASDKVDAVFVLSPSQYHIEQARAVLRAGKHVLVEKPVSRRPRDISALSALAARRGRVCLPGHNYAYIPEYQRIKRLVRDGSLGVLRLTAIFFAVAHSEEVASHYDGVNWLVMPHHAYLVHGLWGLPASVTAGVTEPTWKEIRQDDQAWFVLDYPPHGTAMLFTTLGADDDSADPWSFVVKAIGSGGSASASWRAGVVRRAIGSMGVGWAPYEEAYDAQLQAFISAVGGDESRVASTMFDAIAVARIVRTAEASIRGRRTVLLK